MPEILCSLVLGPFEEPTECVSKVAAGTLLSCSTSLLDLELGDATGCLAGFLGFCGLDFLIPVCLLELVLGAFEEPLSCVSEVTWGTILSCSADSSVEIVELDAIGCWRNIPGTTTILLLGSNKPLFSCCSLSVVSNFFLLSISELDWRSFSLSSTSFSSRF